MKSSRQAAQLLAILLAAASNAQPAVNALWVYSVGGLLNPVTDTQTRQTLIQNSAGSAVNMIYVSVYSSITNSQGRLLYNEISIAALITAAHTNNIERLTRHPETRTGRRSVAPPPPILPSGWRISPVTTPPTLRPGSTASYSTWSRDRTPTFNKC